MGREVVDALRRFRPDRLKRIYLHMPQWRQVARSVAYRTIWSNAAMRSSFLPELRAALRSVADPAKAPQMQAYMKSKQNFARSDTRRSSTGAKRYAAFQTPASVPMYEELVVTGAWWDYVDVIASRRLGPLLKRYPTSMRRKPDHQRSLITKIQYLALAIPPSHRQRLSDPRDRNTLETGYRDFEYRVHFTLSLHAILDSL